MRRARRVMVFCKSSKKLVFAFFLIRPVGRSGPSLWILYLLFYILLCNRLLLDILINIFLSSCDPFLCFYHFDFFSLEGVVNDDKLFRIIFGSYPFCMTSLDIGMFNYLYK